jgi:hypothetical protein
MDSDREEIERQIEEIESEIRALEISILARRILQRHRQLVRDQARQLLDECILQKSASQLHENSVK